MFKFRAIFLQVDDEGDPLVYGEDDEQQQQQQVQAVPYNRQQCKLCLKTFEDEEKFVQDQTTHLVQFSNLEEPVKCPLCRATVETKWGLNDHMRSVTGQLDAQWVTSGLRGS